MPRTISQRFTLDGKAVTLRGYDLDDSGDFHEANRSVMTGDPYEGLFGGDWIEWIKGCKGRILTAQKDRYTSRVLFEKEEDRERLAREYGPQSGWKRDAVEG